MNERKPRSSRRDGSGTFPTVAREAARALRMRAQEKARTQLGGTTADFTSLTADEARKVLHELQVHQIELELQNDELRRTQGELQESRARYFDLYDLAPVGYVTIDQAGLVQEANLAVTDLLLLTRGVLVEHPWTRFICPEDQDVYFIHRKRLLASGTPQRCELRLLRTDREPLWVKLEARVAKHEDGSWVARTIVIDIDARKRAQAGLQGSEARHRALFEMSHDALLTLAPPTWQFASANRAAVQLFGATDEDALKQLTLWQLSADTQPDAQASEQKARRLFERAIQEGEVTVDWCSRRVNGEPFQAAIVLTRMEVSTEFFVQATVTDTTRQQEERALAAQTERLASMGLLAASVGHEINNPLTYVLASLEVMARLLARLPSDTDPQLRDELVEKTTSALDGARRITRISKVLSGFSRVGSQERCAVDLALAIASALGMAHNEIRFRAQLIEDLGLVPRVWATEGKLAQVFLNLLINACHAMEGGDSATNWLTVRTWCEGNDVFAEVRDTGPGIAAEHISLIFQPFFSTRRSGSGSGLGLSICRSILVEFGGDIRVESELGHGTRFVVRLPAWTPELEVRGLDPALAGVARPTLRGRVLIVDDEAQLRTVMQRLLKEHDVVTACSGAEACELLACDQDFDVILCDLMMPGLTGVDVHCWLRDHYPTLADRLVFVTGGAFGPAADYVAHAGNPQLEKPFNGGQFRAVVAEGVRTAKRVPPQSDPEHG